MTIISNTPYYMISMYMDKPDPDERHDYNTPEIKVLKKCLRTDHADVWTAYKRKYKNKGLATAARNRLIKKIEAVAELGGIKMAVNEAFDVYI